MSKAKALFILPVIVCIAFLLFPTIAAKSSFLIICASVFCIYEFLLIYLIKKQNTDPKTETMIHLALSGGRFFIALILILVGITTQSANKYFALIGLLAIALYYLIFGNIFQAKIKK